MSTTADPLLDLGAFSLGGEVKQRRLLPILQSLCRLHYAACEPYRRVVDRVFGGAGSLTAGRLEDLPFLPVSLFKSQTLRSVPPEAVTRVLTSSGTGGQEVSHVYLDARTARLQAAALVRVGQAVLGTSRRPMVVVDHPEVLRDRSTFTARGAGILGLLQFGHRPFWALGAGMELDLDGLEAYLSGALDRPPLFFGFTFMVWQHLVRALEQGGRCLKPSGGTLVHSGGWKKLQDQAVTPQEFRERAARALGVARVVNFYGMAEQVGGVFFENEQHHLQASVFSEVIVRDPRTLVPLPPGEVGLIQTLSVLPESYPGHSILTEDLGAVIGDGVVGGVQGRSFDVLGRVPRAELRGCSDTYQAAMEAGDAGH